MRKSKTLFLMSGSIAAFKAAQVISRLVQEGHEVQAVLTASASRFIGAATLEGLTGRAPLADLWEAGRAMEHIHLTRWADRAVLCPASANTVAKLAHGLADDLVSALALAWPAEKPFFVFPAMNTVMFKAAATQDNLRTLRARGFHITEPAAGNLACGETGEGRLPEPEDILRVLSAGGGAPAAGSAVAPVAAATASKGRVLITAGATREPIDGIRFIANVSTGQTGATLADLLAERGWSVTYLHGQGARLPDHAAHRVAFRDFQDLDRKLRAELDQRDYKAVVHSAAVSDYSVEGANSKVKLESGQPLQLTLKPNPKLLPRLKSYSRDKAIRVIGFKLTLNTDPAARAVEMLGENVDAVVANEWSQVERDRSGHPGTVVTPGSQKPFHTLQELAEVLNDLMS
jgi:phosphopantothenoylcysteine decarboxylase/phosphopantothenate--cysteine ligase